MMFYTTVAGWMLHYFYMTAIGQLSGLNAEQVAGKFTEMLASPGVMTFWMVFVVVLGILVCAKGLQNGLERVTKVMMIALLAIMVVLAVNSLFMPGAKEGLEFYLVPDFARMQEVGVVNTLVSAMNQAFFTLSLGIGAMAIFGSYIGSGSRPLSVVHGGGVEQSGRANEQRFHLERVVAVMCHLHQNSQNEVS